MKVLVICRAKNDPRGYGMASFVKEQADVLVALGVEIDFYTLNKNAILNILHFKKEITQKLQADSYDLIHAHTGPIGFVASLQDIVPVVVTYHGSDINKWFMRVFSRMAIKRAVHNIFVSKKMMQKVSVTAKASVIPCGIDANSFTVKDKIACRKILGWDTDGTYVLFPAKFTNAIKNYPLAQKAVEGLPDVKTIELSGYDKDMTVNVFNACDLMLMTSFSEGSPQVVKEAILCNLPVVSTDVGDVRERLEGIKNCYVADKYDENELRGYMQRILGSKERSDGREKSSDISLVKVAEKILRIYQDLDTGE